MVAAAQRRLAALAERHARDEGAGEPVDDAAGAVAPSLPDRDPLLSDRGAARHAAPPRGAGYRWGLTAQQVTVVAVLLVAVLIAVAWWALRSTPRLEPIDISSQRPLPASSPTVSLATAPPPVGSAGGAIGPASGPDTTIIATTRLVVDVAGRVRRPGIVELPQGARVVDALAAAGGVRPGVKLMSLNLARPLVDGEQIVVGVDVPDVPPPSGSAPASGSLSQTIAPVDINTATAEQLDTLPGVGPVTAQAILQWRSDNGPFASVDELLEVSGIGDATLSDLRPYVYV